MIEFADSILVETRDSVIVPHLLKHYHYQDPVVDVTYGMGRFWEKWDGDVIGCDIDAGGKFSPKATHKADYRDLPFPDGSVGTIIFDPPHLARPNNENATSIYGMYNIEVFDNDMEGPLREFLRVLKPGGLVIAKLANEISRDNFHTVEFWNAAKKLGFIRFDEVIKKRQPSIRNPAQKQHRARRVHCYFLIAKKKGKPLAKGQELLI